MADVANAESLTEQASGSVGNVTFGRNQYGSWTRTRATPADPATALQVSVRSHLATCVTAWNTTLTQAERDTWNQYALTLRQPSPIRRQTNVGGIGMYVRSNVPRLQAAEASLPRVDVAPSLFDLGPFTLPRPVLLDAASDTAQVFFTQSDAWTTELGAAMLIWTSPPVATTRTFYKGPYRYAGPILGNPSTPPSSPATIPLAFPAPPDQRIHIRGRLTRSDARLSSSFRIFTTGPALPGPTPYFAVYFPSPYFQCFIYFTPALQPGSLNRFNWSIRWNDQRWSATTATAFPGYVHFYVTRPAADPGVNGVDFDPPPFDVRDALTGVPAPAFTDYPFD